jgi:hypothetical protein
MLPVSKDNLCIFGILVCIVGLFYLYKEITNMKKSVVSGGRPSQSVPLESFIPQRVHTPVYDTPVVAPQPQPQVVQSPSPPVASKEE